jgi:hypothetical protein
MPTPINNSLIPYNKLKKVKKLAKKLNRLEQNTRNGSGISGNLRNKMKKYISELPRIPVPAVPPSNMISCKDRDLIERTAHKEVKKGWRPKAEYYPIPEWIKKNKTYKKYYIARLEMEISLRQKQGGGMNAG